MFLVGSRIETSDWLRVFAEDTETILVLNRCPENIRLWESGTLPTLRVLPNQDYERATKQGHCIVALELRKITQLKECLCGGINYLPYHVDIGNQQAVPNDDTVHCEKSDALLSSPVMA